MKNICDKSISVGYNRQDTIVIVGYLEVDSERGRYSNRIRSVGSRGRDRENFDRDRLSKILPIREVILIRFD